MDASFTRYRGYIAMTLVFILVLIGTVFILRQERDDASVIEISTPIPRATPTEALIVIDVQGAIATPGVHRLPEGSRVQDVLARAGVLPNADTSGLNLARRLNDGEKIVVPKLGEATPTASAAASVTPTRAASVCLSYKDAGAHLNESTCVRGLVTAAEKSGSNFFIFFDDASTSFYAISFNHTWDNLRGKCVEISGKIVPFRGRPEIVIDKQDQLNLCR